MKKDDIELPELPVPRTKTDGGIELFAEYSVREYARAAIEPYKQRIAELEAQLEAVGAGGVSSQRVTSQRGGEPVAWQWLDTAHFRKRIPDHSNAEEWRPLFTAPQSNNPCTMGEHGCDDPSQCWEPCGELGKSSEHAKVAEPVEVPSDSEIMWEWANTPNTGDMRVDLSVFARALLARHDQPVEPEGWQLVPKVPTYEMIQALWETITVNHDTTDGGYKAMLEAAPKFGEEE